MEDRAGVEEERAGVYAGDDRSRLVAEESGLFACGLAVEGYGEEAR